MKKNSKPKVVILSKSNPEMNCDYNFNDENILEEYVNREEDHNHQSQKDIHKIEFAPKITSMLQLTNGATVREDGCAKLRYDDIDRDSIVRDLSMLENISIERMDPIIGENGAKATEDGTIEPENLSWAAGYIPSVAFIGDIDDCKYCPTTVCNTFNKGLRYSSVDSEGNTIDCGPVVTPIIMGTVKEPHGLYIPFNNRRSIIDGVNFAMDFLDFIDCETNESRADDFSNCLDDAIRREESKKFGW